ncbi:MAG: hypothetical protein J1F67_05945 [Muribaculaceae bacterium]|nr:hypothetical protein [Muribaculaceae bacterium]
MNSFLWIPKHGVMTTTQKFNTFLTNIKVDNDETLSNRYGEITKKLNQRFRGSDSEVNNRLQVGSYGRYTGIKGISDLDMLYIMPDSLWDKYKNDPKKLLQETKDALIERYPRTKIKIDRLVVVVDFCNFKFEVQPVFQGEEKDDIITYQFPDTKYGYFRVTMPKHEQEAMTSFRENYGDTHRRLCKMMRAWTNHMGVHMGGLLLDTLAYNFLKNDEDLATTPISKFDTLCQDFFEFLKNEPVKDHYQALGSGQDVKVKKKFQTKAKKAFKLSCKAINSDNEEEEHSYWRDIFGNNFPKAETVIKNFSSFPEDKEEFIEEKYPISIQGNLNIDCEIKSNGFRERLLSSLLRDSQKIARVKSLEFFIDSLTIPEPYEVLWKVRNVGDEAIRRNCLRGQIIPSNTPSKKGRKETSNFRGPHYVECYILKEGYIVARDRIEVPIL